MFKKRSERGCCDQALPQTEQNTGSSAEGPHREVNRKDASFINQQSSILVESTLLHVVIDHNAMAEDSELEKYVTSLC